MQIMVVSRRGCRLFFMVLDAVHFFCCVGVFGVSCHNVEFQIPIVGEGKFSRVLEPTAEFVIKFERKQGCPNIAYTLAMFNVGISMKGNR
jgi:hypothetical protein